LGGRAAACPHGRGQGVAAGGCAIGTRPVDLFIDGLQQLGANIDVENGLRHRQTKNGRLTGNRYVFQRCRSGRRMC